MSQQIQIVIVEDAIEDAELFVRELRRAHFDPQWHRVETEAEYLEKLHPGVDLILSDYKLPEFDGPRALELLKEKGYDIPFIVVSGTIGEETAVATIKLGATDYILKDRLGRLGTAVSNALKETRLRAHYRRSEAALIESERKFRMLAENLTDVLWIGLPDLQKMEYVSPAYELIWGRTLASFAANPNEMFEAIVPEDLQHVLATLAQLKDGKPSISLEHRIARPDGSIRWVHCRGFQIRDETGRVVRLTGIITDITERRQALEQIAEQAALLDEARDAILVTDLQGRALFWNEGAERLYGWTRQEVLGRKLGELFHLDPRKFEEISHQTISQGEWHGELQHLTKDQRELVIEARWTLIRDSEGCPKSVLAINSDVTEKKKIEAQFMRAQRMESIGTLAGGIAHDLNNILAPIMMSIELLKTLSREPQAQSILETIEVSARRGADIVRQVLSFARGLEGERIEVQPKHLLKDLENIIRDTFPKDIRLHFTIPTDIWTILGDPTQIHQILLNLSVNARDAMPNGGNLSIEVENCHLDEQYAAMNLDIKPGRYVNISVTDSGVGIPPGLLDKIFEPFFTTKDINKGTGLGLSTVMAIVKSHGGLVNVYSEPGNGTTFRIYLPAVGLAADGQPVISHEDDLPRGKGETILVVDDEASVLTVTRQTLNAFGYRVITAADGAEAVALYAQNRNDINLVLTDMMMPVMDGPATIRALMRINPAARIIAASGLHANASLAKASGVGVKHFLIKPYTAGTLLKTLRLVLDEE